MRTASAAGDGPGRWPSRGAGPGPAPLPARRRRAARAHHVGRLVRLPYFAAAGLAGRPWSESYPRSGVVGAGGSKGGRRRATGPRRTGVRFGASRAGRAAGGSGFALSIGPVRPTVLLRGAGPGLRAAARQCSASAARRTSARARGRRRRPGPRAPSGVSSPGRGRPRAGARPRRSGARARRGSAAAPGGARRPRAPRSWAPTCTRRRCRASRPAAGRW